MVSVDINLLLASTIFLTSAVLLSGVEGAPKTCHPQTDYPVMQSLCRETNEAMLAAEEDGDNKLLCKNVILFLKCVAHNISRCYTSIEEQMAFYFHSPVNCVVTQKILREIQGIINEQKKKSKPSKNPGPTSTSESDRNNNNDNNNGDSLPSTLPDGTTSDGVDNNNSNSNNNNNDGSGADGSGGGGGELVTPSSQSSSPSNVIHDKDGDVSKGKGYNVTGEGSSEEHKGSQSKPNNSVSSLTTSAIFVAMATALSMLIRTSTST